MTVLDDPSWALQAADGRERARRRPSAREIAVDAAALAVFAISAVLLLVLDGGVAGWSWVDAAVLLATYALACKIELDVGSGYTVPTQLVLVVALLVLAPAAVPLLVIAALVAADAPAVVRGRLHPLKLLIAGGDAIHALAPAAVLAVADPGAPALSHALVYLAALAAQFAVDLVTTLIRERLRVGVAPRELLGELRFLYAMDAVLTPIGLCGALATAQGRYGYLLIMPVLVYAHMLAKERTRRMQDQVALAEASAAAQTDVLTGALNRRGWDEAFGRLLAEPGRELTVALLDVDGLKAVNDGQGHAAGDALLAGAAAGWRAVLRTQDVIGRIGGDEFAVCFPGRSESDVEAICARLRGCLPGGHTCSAGCASARPGETAEMVVARADIRLYEDKRSRRFSRV